MYEMKIRVRYSEVDREGIARLHQILEYFHQISVLSIFIYLFILYVIISSFFPTFPILLLLLSLLYYLIHLFYLQKFLLDSHQPLHIHLSFLF